MYRTLPHTHRRREAGRTISFDPNLRPTAQFHAFAVITVTVADRLFGVGSHESKAVKHAWDQVGVAA